MRVSSSWVVLKFGGTSVSTPARWATIADLVRRRLDEGLRPLVVCSALSGVSNQLEALLAAAVAGRHEEPLAAIEQRHLELGTGLGLAAAPLLRDDFEELSRLALAASLLREAGPALQARVMAFGEILSTRLGAAFLTSQGIATAWHDARTSLVAREESPASGPRAYLSASCDFDRDEELIAALSALPASAVITQGFIARNGEGQTVLLGRGGSDTSAAYFAARLGVVRCEIWTDVPGLFTANPSLLPSARLLRALDYDEAQEIASMGAKVLHPRSIPPLRRHGIPLQVLCTDRPDAPGTVISSAGAGGAAGESQVKAISSRNGITLISMETIGMWQEVGFLAQAFAAFAQHGLSIDSVSTSESNVTVSLDPQANVLGPAGLAPLLRDLALFCEPRLIAPTTSISLVGRGIRAILHELGPVLEAFEELRVHLMTLSASDLNLTFLVDQDQSERLIRQLHGLLFSQRGESALFGPTWSELFGEAAEEAPVPPHEWWRGRRRELLELAAARGPVYAYDGPTLRAAAASLQGLAAVECVLYALKANRHPGVLRVFHDAGLGFECVSAAELDHVLALFPAIAGERLLFTPNFAPCEEYRHGFEVGARVTVDNVHPLREWPEVFRGRELFLRLDPGRGRGHHAHVRTAGAQSKFGLAPEQMEEARALLAACGARVVGLHAHVGSGVRSPEAWSEVALFLAEAAERFPDARVLDLGGGLGVPERPEQSPLDLDALGELLGRFKAANPRFELWLEPGRFLVAQAGVLLARVTQIKRKSEVMYVGLETGMNSLIRPPLYGAYHRIVNLSRLDEPSTWIAHVVGPICETGDILGRSRRLPPTAEGDVVLIANAGAYGRVMSSRYNLREPAGEALLDP